MSSYRIDSIRELPTAVARWWYGTSAEPSRREVLLAFGGPPAVLAIVWVLPIGTEWGLSLAADSVFENAAVLTSVYTASYVHVDGLHLFDNVLNYLVTMFAIYPLAAIAGWKRNLVRAAVVYVTVGPIAIAWVTLSTLGPVTDQTTLGFSGLSAALLGFLVVVLFAALHRVSDGHVHAAWAIVPFCGSVAVAFAVPNVPHFPIRPGLAGVLGLGSVLATGVFVRRRPQVGTLATEHRLALLIGATVATFGVLGALVFVRGGTNVWGHLGGYGFGFFVPYVAFVLGPTIERHLTVSR
ncbi:MAG: hypothetical protein ACQETB_10540 [Halobacteriota archaeon]